MNLSIGDLTIQCLGVHATESLDVCVANNFVRMMTKKKVARNKSSNSNSARSTSSNGLGLILSFFGIKEFCFPCSCRRLARIFVVGLNFLTILSVAHQRDGALVPVPLMPGCGKRDVDRRDAVQESAIFFCPSVGLLRISILFTLLPPDYDVPFVVFPFSSSGIHCFPMVLISLSLVVFLAP